MSTPDSSPQSPPPNASDAAAAPPAANDLPSSGESSSNGQTAAGAEGAPSPTPGETPSHADASPSEATDASHADSTADGSSQPQGEKKRRRRRRKKKGAGPALADGSTPAEGAEGASDEEGESAETVEDGAPGEGGEAKPAGKVEGKGEGRPGDRKKDPRKERKQHGPTRERPPVNGGDIVFGKILEILDDAILIDIPGRARAIFDRREMLLADDEEAAAQAKEPVSADAVTPPDSAPEAEPAGAPAASSDEAPAAAPDVALPTPDARAEGTPAAAATVASADATPPATGADAPREPKVPRVILEVGADFIGVVHNDGARGGLVVLTHHPRRLEKAKPAIEKAFAEKQPVLGLVTGVIKGGIEVDVDGLRAFAPGSHVDLRLGADLSHLVTKRLPFYVTQYAKRGRDVVLSRRALLEEDSKKARSEALSKLKVGEERDGIVRSVVAFGAFIDVGGIEGLVPLQEMSHNRADGPSDVFRAGEPTRVVVTKVDDKGKVWLSRKATIPDPWQQVAQKYTTGTRHAGKVVRIQPFGAFIELEPGVDGLIHTADISIKRIETPEEVVKVGDPIEVVVAHVDPSNHKIALHPAPQGAEADEAPQKVGPHKPVKAKIVTIEAGGLVVRILGVTGRNARGYVTGAGTGTARGTELRKAFNVGQLVDAKVIEMDPRRGEIKLSIKALSEDQERNAYQQYRQQLKAEARFTFGDLLAKKGNPQR